MLPFFSLSPSTKRERISMLRKAFIFVAGDNFNEFIKHFLTMIEFGKKFLPIAQNQKNLEILENLKALMQNSPPKHLPALCSLVTSNYSLKDLNFMGFNMTKSEFEYSRKIKKQKKLL